MKFLEYGVNTAPLVLLIHGMGCTGEHSFQTAKDLLADSYKVIIVCLNGYDEPTNVFTSISDEACQIANYINMHYNGKLHTLLGMSMGGFIALELLTRHHISTEKLILDSGYMPPWSKITAKPMSKMVAWGFHKLITGKSNLLISGSMKQIMGYCFLPKDLCSFSSKETIRNSEYSCLTYQLPELTVLSNTYIEYWYGTKDKNMICGLKSLKEKLPHIKEVCFGDYGHGEFMFTYPNEYGQKIYETVTKVGVEK